jgi:hypothetical protein
VTSSYLQWSDGDETCVGVEVMMDDGPSAKTLSDVLKTWAVEQSDAAIEVEGASISVTSCSQ